MAFAHGRFQQFGEVSEITDGVFFTFKDPDGNLMMVADVPPAVRSE